jgi:cell division protein FtsQ
LQQVGVDAFANAAVVDPAQLPALVGYPSRRARLNLGRVWVLHRARLLQGLAALVCCAGIGVTYAERDRLGELGSSLYELGQVQLAHSQLGIAQISITGQAMTSEHDIVAALGLTPQTSMVSFDADAARTAIEKLPAVLEATVRKSYPSHLFVAVTERVPVARWRVNETTYVIDQTGARIGENGGDFAELPLVIGEDAGDDAMVMIRAMSQFASLKQGLVALSRIADRRWDMIYTSGLRVQLPEQGVAQALGQLTTLEGKYQLLDRDVSLIDLRVPGVVAVKPSEAAAAQLAAIAKANVAKNKGNFKQDADYSAPGAR